MPDNNVHDFESGFKHSLSDIKNIVLSTADPD